VAGASEPSRPALEDAIGFLQQALQLGSGVKALQREALYYTSFAFHLLDDVERRDEFAARFNEIAT
jgi:hypothetical protein